MLLFIQTYLDILYIDITSEINVSEYHNKMTFSDV